jgi:hypothetical protein
MDESDYVETSLAACLKEHELPVIDGALAMRGPFRVVVGAYDFDTGFFDGAVDRTVSTYEEASAVAIACRDEALAAFKREILKIRCGVREGRLTGMEPVGLVCLVLGSFDRGTDFAVVGGLSVAWDFQRASGRELYAVDWPDNDWDLEE